MKSKGDPRVITADPFLLEGEPGLDDGENSTWFWKVPQHTIGLQRQGKLGEPERMLKLGWWNSGNDLWCQYIKGPQAPRWTPCMGTLGVCKHLGALLLDNRILLPSWENLLEIEMLHRSNIL